MQALAAKHRIALNRIGESVLITTGRKLAAGFPNGADSVVVLLDGEAAFDSIEAGDIEIYWGANIGTPQEALASGASPTRRRRSRPRGSGCGARPASSWTPICCAGASRRSNFGSNRSKVMNVIDSNNLVRDAGEKVLTLFLIPL